MQEFESIMCTIKWDSVKPVRISSRPRLPATTSALRIFCLCSLITLCNCLFPLPHCLSFAAGEDEQHATTEHTLSSTVAWLEFRNGSIIECQIENQSIPWITVQRSGQTSTDTITLNKVQSVFFTLEPASEQVARTRRLIDRLNAADFHERNQAEQTLVAECGPFIEVIKASREKLTEPEARFRLERVLKELSSATLIKLELDIIRVDGKIIEGDAGDWQVKGRIGGTEFSLDRNRLRNIYFENPFPNLLPLGTNPNQALQREYFTNHVGHFYMPSQTHITFDKDQHGKSVQRTLNQNAHELFAFQGVKLRSELPGWQIVVAGYRFLRGLSKENSIGTYYHDEATNSRQRYTGVTEVTFCDPNESRLSATVDSAGLFLEIVSPRQHIFEAYNSAGHRIGLVETHGEEKTSFLGLKTNDRISRLRILPNHHLNLPKAEQNEDYAIDDLCIADLTRASDVNPSDQYLVMFHSGEHLFCSQVELDDQKVTVRDSAFGDELTLSFDLSKVLSILGPNHASHNSRQAGASAADDAATTNHDGFSVMLNDGSIVNATSANGMHIESNQFGKLDWSQATGIWSGKTAYYPMTDVIANDNAVAVYPIREIQIASYEIKQDQFHAGPDALKIHEQNADLGLGDPIPSADSLRDGLTFQFSEAPSLWFNQPPTSNERAGLLRLKDGQQFLFGDDSALFTLDRIDVSAITISYNGHTGTYGLDEVSAFRLPRIMDK